MIHACTTTTHTITTTARIIYSGTHCSRYHPAHTHHTPPQGNMQPMNDTTKVTNKSTLAHY